ncbi:MAG: NADH-quinone oxidoreductase subunit K [Deltaproteobacteria bacterium RIFOXYD12_FULL_57_12]|nr:MAG: NADH-quinone oxidoreductase subunit K [Deltaproteobacteria bacterium RIFOXYD12_FULL_57_12]
MSIMTISNSLDIYLLMAALLFGMGIYGIVQRQTFIGMLIAAELILSGASINFMAFNRFLAPDPTVGQIFTLFIMGIAAAEAAIALSIIIVVYRNYRSIETVDVVELNG